MKHRSADGDLLLHTPRIAANFYISEIGQSREKIEKPLRERIFRIFEKETAGA